MSRSIPRLALGAVILTVLVPRALGAQDAAPPFGRAGTGLGLGVTMSSIALAGMLTSGNGNACTGSGDYLRTCRLLFVGGVALGGGVGSLVGALVRKAAPSGRVRPIVLGAAAGSVVPFLVSFSTCEQEQLSNPERLCGRHGMVTPGVTIAGAAVGALVGYLIGGLANGLDVAHMGPVLTTRGAPAFEVRLQRSWSF